MQVRFVDFLTSSLNETNYYIRPMSSVFKYHSCRLIKYLLIGVISFCHTNLFAQQQFNGAFLMSFTNSVNSVEDFPLEWQIESKADGGKMMLEIKDEANKKGVKKRVMFNPLDSTWTMLMEIGTVRQGSKVHRAMMFRDSVLSEKVNITATKEYKTINNYSCRKYIRESKRYHSEIWVSSKFDFDICKIYYLLSHCGMMSDFMRKGDWFYWKNSRGMIMEITSKDKQKEESYSIQISQIELNKVNPQLFVTKGYKISEIPEGQNCGVAVEEK
ncbi:hypothetical protein BH11BAC2_BH11BAC2_26620 [soil metagenome]